MQVLLGGFVLPFLRFSPESCGGIFHAQSDKPAIQYVVAQLLAQLPLAPDTGYRKFKAPFCIDLTVSLTPQPVNFRPGTPIAA